MGNLYSAFLNAGISGAVMIAAVAVLRLLLKASPRKMLCLLWIPVLVRLLLPFSIPAPFSLQPDLHFLPDTGVTAIIGEESMDVSVDTPPIALDPGVFPMPQVNLGGVQRPSHAPEITNPTPSPASISPLI